MMSELNARLQAITKMAERILAERDMLQEEVSLLRSNKEDLQRENEGLRKRLNEEEHNLHILQTANSLNSRVESEEAKNKVDDLLREIEHCLKILDS